MSELTSPASERAAEGVASRIATSPSNTRRRLRIYYIYPETMGLHPDPERNPLHYLSDRLEGDYAAIWVVDSAREARERAPQVNAASGRFRFHWTRIHPVPFGMRRVWEFLFWVAKGLALSLRHGRYDAIIAYGPFSTALAGMTLRFLTGSKLIVEFPGHPFRSYDLYPGRIARLKRRVAPAWTRLVADAADHVRLLYPDQLDELGRDYSGKRTAFHDFTTVSRAVKAGRAVTAHEPYVLFLGFPFHLKGVDVLIRAFNIVSDRFPEYRLLIVGHCPDPEPYRRMAGSNARIEIRPPVPHEQALDLMARCSMFVLASRTEGMARVLLEAMGAGRPVISSAVGGIPHYIRHGATGLLFESENVDELAAHLERLMRDRTYAEGMGARAREAVLGGLTEEHYADAFADMIERVAAGH